MRITERLALADCVEGHKQKVSASMPPPAPGDKLDGMEGA